MFSNQVPPTSAFLRSLSACAPSYDPRWIDPCHDELFIARQLVVFQHFLGLVGSDQAGGTSANMDDFDLFLLGMKLWSNSNFHWHFGKHRVDVLPTLGGLQEAAETIWSLSVWKKEIKVWSRMSDADANHLMLGKDVG